MSEVITVYTIRDMIKEMRQEIDDLRCMVHDLRPQMKIARTQLGDHLLDHLLLEDKLGDVCEEHLAPFKRAIDDYMIKLDQAFISLSDDFSDHVKECMRWGEVKE